MAISKKIILLFILVIFLGIRNQAQEGYEIHFNDPTIDEVPWEFISDNNDGFTGFVRKIKEINGTRIASDYLYHISPFGDTTSVLLSKQDTLSYHLGELIHVSTEPSGYLVMGYGFVPNKSSYKRLTFFTRLNENLEILWEKVFYFDFEYLATRQTIIEEPNGDLLTCCTPEGQYMFIFRMSQNGDSLRFRQYEGDESGQIYSTTYNHDSSNILLHTSGAYYNPMEAGWCKIITLDSNWNHIAVTDYPRDFYPSLTARLLPNKKILTCGSIIYSQYHQYIAAYLLNEDLTIENTFYLNNYDTISRTAYNICTDNSSSNTFIGGTVYLNNTDQGLKPSWFYVAKLNDTLGTIFEKYIGGEAAYWLHSLAASPDGGVLLTGTREELTNDTTQYDGYLIKLDAYGTLTNLEEYQDVQIKNALVYPNPASEYLFVRTAVSNAEFSIFDISGNIARQYPLQELISKIAIEDLAAGTYIWRVTQQSKIIETGKFIKTN